MARGGKLGADWRAGNCFAAWAITSQPGGCALLLPVAEKSFAQDSARKVGDAGGIVLAISDLENIFIPIVMLDI